MGITDKGPVYRRSRDNGSSESYQPFNAAGRKLGREFLLMFSSIWLFYYFRCWFLTDSICDLLEDLIRSFNTEHRALL